jgi:hypothetical protein
LKIAGFDAACQTKSGYIVTASILEGSALPNLMGRIGAFPAHIPLIVLSHGRLQRMPGLSEEVNREFEQTWAADTRRTGICFTYLHSKAKRSADL